MDTIDLGEAKVLLADPQIHSRRMMRDALNMIGFRKIELVNNIDDMRTAISRFEPDLIFVDFDNDRDNVCKVIHNIRNRKIGNNPFVAVVALTWSPEEGVVRAALTSGTDDMLSKPVSPKLLRDRTVNLIKNRRDFVVTHNYVGPDRRSGDREAGEDDLPTLAVPNSLRHATTGDDQNGVDAEKIAETVRSLCAQKVYRLASEIVDLTTRLKETLAEDGDVDPRGPVIRITDMLDQIEGLITEQKFDSIKQISSTARQVIEHLVDEDGTPNKKQFELLHLNAQGMVVTLKQSDEAAGALASALQKAEEAVSESKETAPAAA